MRGPDLVGVGHLRDRLRMHEATPPRSGSRPVRESGSISSTLAAVGTGSSFCRPSRGPTSRSEIRSGRSLIPASLPRPLRLTLLVEGGDALAPVGGECGGAPGRVLHLQPRRERRCLPPGGSPASPPSQRSASWPPSARRISIACGHAVPPRHDLVGEPDPRGFLRVHPAAENTRSAALPGPRRRSASWVPPPPGTRPTVVSGRPNSAVSSATMTSQDRASSQPPPRA